MVFRKAQYETQFKKWKWRKNFTKNVWENIFMQIHQRSGRESEVYVNGILIPPHKVKKEVARHVPPSFQYASGTSPGIKFKNESG